MRTNAHIKQYINKITLWLEQKGFQPEVVQHVMRVVIVKSNGYTNPLLMFDKESILVNIVHSRPIPYKYRGQLTEQLEQLNIEGVSYAYGFDKYDRALMYADLLPISGSNADSDNRLDEFCQRAFIVAPQMLDDLVASTIETPVIINCISCEYNINRQVNY